MPVVGVPVNTCGGRVTEVTRADGTRFTVTVPFMGMEPETDGARYFHAWIRENTARQRAISERAAMIRARYGDYAHCEARFLGCSGIAVDTHEILTRGRGGSITDGENTLPLCRPCHKWITEHPAWSDAHGWTLHSWDRDAERARQLRALHCALTCTEDHQSRENP
jgi:hypothetical protein